MIMKKIIKLIIPVLFLLSLFPSSSYPYAYPEKKKNVLILNSYHQGYKWTDDEIRGIESGLFPVSENTNIYIEYMGTKWNYSSEYFEQLNMLYKKKFSSIRFDVIISTDDDAFNFIKEYRDKTFGNVPVVFCGLNWLTAARLRGITRATGVNEATDIELNIYLMMKLHSNVKKIYVIMDSTTTGNSVYNKLEEISPRFNGKIDIIPLYNLKMENMLHILSGLKKDSIVLLALFSRDSDGRFFEYNKYSRMISESSSVPVYGLWDFYLGYGVVGGNVASGYSQGFTAGNIALRSLKGEPVESIPVVMDSPNTYMFDYNEMKKFGIPGDILPPESIIINQPVSFYSVNKRIFHGIIVITAALAVFTTALTINIRKRYLAEKSLSESLEQYSTLVNNLHVGVFRSSGDEDGSFIHVNSAMMTIFGYEQDSDFLSRPVKSLYREPSERVRFLEEIKKAGTVRNRELQMMKKDGTDIAASVTASATFNEGDGSLKWIDGILEDITEKKKMEQDMRHAQKMETIGTMASGIAHDFNNALGGLIGVISILDNKLRSGLVIPHEKQLEYITIMKESGEKGVSMVRRLLAIARRRETESSPVDINVIAGRVKELLGGVIDKTIKVNTVYTTDKAIIHADPSQIEQVLLNLCINAGHAMTIMRSRHEEWGGTLTIMVSRIQADKYLLLAHPGVTGNEYWCISVTDTGVGMTDDIRGKVFEPFFTTKGEGFGTGLGLAMVRKIISEHGGFIDVYSEPGIGTTFKLYLPVSYDEPEITEIPCISELPYGSGLILVVEDEPVMAKITSEILKECGYDVLSADNGENAMRIFRERYSDITAVVMDMAMPVMSGITAFRELRKINPDVKVLITSGVRQDARVEEVLSLGAAGFIEKPYTLESLGFAVKDILDS